MSNFEFYGFYLSLISVLIAAFGLFLWAPLVALISLLLVETLAIGLWWYYARNKNKVLFPYPFEIPLVICRYVFNTQSNMYLEVIKVIKITQASMNDLRENYTWSGLGNICVRNLITMQTIDYTPDRHGHIAFEYPLSHTCIFGDYAVVHHRIECQDDTNNNKPVLNWSIRCPTHLCILEVVIKYASCLGSASYGWRPIDSEQSDQILSKYTMEEDVEFDCVTHSYRKEVLNPLIGRNYQLKWNIEDTHTAERVIDERSKECDVVIEAKKTEENKKIDEPCQTKMKTSRLGKSAIKKSRNTAHDKES